MNLLLWQQIPQRFLIDCKAEVWLKGIGHGQVHPTSGCNGSWSEGQCGSIIVSKTVNLAVSSPISEM